jgi:hypothetical protein
MNDDTLEAKFGYKFSDDVIAEIAKQLQVAILTGTDVVDNLRLIEVTLNEGKLSLTQNYVKVSQGRVENMLDFATELVNSKDASEQKTKIELNYE